MGEVQEQLTAREWQERYVAEQARDQDEALRLVALREKAVDVGLSSQEQMERLLLEQAHEDRGPRLQRLQREMATAEDTLNIEDVLSVWDGLVAQKHADYDRVVRAVDDLLSAWKALFHTHQQQEEEMARLPRAGSSLSSFPSGPELAQNISSRLPRGWDGTVNSAHQQAWRIDWAQVLDVDPGLRPLETSAVGRVKETARLYRQKLAQQTAVAQDEAEDE